MNKLLCKIFGHKYKDTPYKVVKGLGSGTIYYLYEAECLTCKDKKKSWS